jgi:hypothetical protein
MQTFSLGVKAQLAQSDRLPFFINSLPRKWDVFTLKDLSLSLLSKIGFSTQRRKGRREPDFLFGGEPFDKLKALSKAEGRPPNKKASVTLE